MRSRAFLNTWSNNRSPLQSNTSCNLSLLKRDFVILVIFYLRILINSKYIPSEIVTSILRLFTRDYATNTYVSFATFYNTDLLVCNNCWTDIIQTKTRICDNCTSYYFPTMYSRLAYDDGCD
jgi:hypothetical protein